MAAKMYRPTVLVVEDDPFMLRRITRMLHAETVLAVLEADNLRKAAEMAEDPYTQIDAALCDIGFLEETRDKARGLYDGLDLLRLVQKSRPRALKYVLSVNADDTFARKRAEQRGLKIKGWFQKLGPIDNPWARIEADLLASTALGHGSKQAARGVPIAQKKLNSRGFDVFLAHNSADKRTVERLALALKERGLMPWFDKWNIPPGRMFQEEIERVLPRIRSVAVICGKSGVGAWQSAEMRLAISQFVKRKLPVIPVLLPGLRKPPALPLFLQEFSWLQFEKSIHDEEVLARFEWGITGKTPSKR